MKIWRMYYIINKKGEIVEQYENYRDARHFFNNLCGNRHGLRIEAYAECICNNGSYIRTAKAETMAEAVRKVKESLGQGSLESRIEEVWV